MNSGEIRVKLMLRRAIICLYSSTRVSPRLQVIRFHPLLWKFCVVCLHEASVFQLTAAKFGWWLNRGRKTGHSRDNILIDYGLNIIWYYIIIIRDHGHDFESWQSRGLVFKFMHYANITSNFWSKTSVQSKAGRKFSLAQGYLRIIMNTRYYWLSRPDQSLATWPEK